MTKKSALKRKFGANLSENVLFLGVKEGANTVGVTKKQRPTQAPKSKKSRLYTKNPTFVGIYRRFSIKPVLKSLKSTQTWKKYFFILALLSI